MSISLDNPATLAPSFTAPQPDSDTAITFTQTADGGRGASSTDTVSVAILAEGSPPDAPQNLRFGATTVTLIWDDPDDATIPGYKVLSRAPAARTHLSTLINNTGSAETAHTVRDLEPATACVFRVAAVNEHGDSGCPNFIRISAPRIAMANRARSAAAVLAVAASLAILAAAAPQATGGDGPGLPKGSVSKGDPAKFDYGFYEKIQDIISEQGSASHQANQKVAPDDDLEYVVPVDTTRYYHTVMVVSGDDQEAIDRNKAALVAILEEMGARDIYPGRVLSFVTARVPVDLLPGLSLYGEVAALGDEELPVTPDDDRARLTIRANLTELAALAGRPLNGSGVTVGIVDYGVNSIFLNDKVVSRNYCPDGGCRFVNGTLTGTHLLDYGPLSAVNSGSVTHGTSVAHVIAATGLPTHNGMAPGVSLVDAHHRVNGTTAALDYALEQGAGVINMSIDGGIHRECSNIHTDTRSWFMNGVVIRGAVLVQSAGNSGYDSYLQQYDYSSVPGCTANHIVVGGLDDRGETLTHWNKSSKGPTNDDFPRLAPHITAPAIITYQKKTTEVDFGTTSGTSYSAPMVSAAAALVLHLKPDLVPTETKSLLLLGANWTGPVPCTSRQYEQNDRDDGCSYAARPGNTGLRVLNHVGFGILDVHRSLSYAKNFSSHVLTEEISPETSPLTYGLNVTGSPGTVKVLLTWLVREVPVDEIADLDLSVTCPWSDSIINAGSTYQTVEFAVFEPDAEGVCALTVAGSGVNGTPKDFTLAATHPLVDAPASLAVGGLLVSSTTSAEGTIYLGGSVRVAVAFPRAVAVSDQSPPYLSMDVGQPGARAAYNGTGPAGRVLYFDYQVLPGHAAADLDYDGTDALVLPGDDSITDAHTGILLQPTLPAPGGPGSLGHASDITVDGTRDGPPRMVSAWAVHPGRISVLFSETVDANRTDGTGWTLEGPDAGPPRISVTANTDPGGSSANMTLTLSGDLPDTAPDLTLSYAQPATRGITGAGGTPAVGASVPVGDRLGPVTSSVTRHDPALQLTSQTALTFQVTFSEPVTGVDASDFELSRGTGSVTGVTGSGATRDVAVRATSSGTFDLDVSSSNDIIDAAGNPLSGAAPDPDQTYLVDASVPSVTGITRHDPTDRATSRADLVFRVTFSEPVTGVDRADFELSRGTGSVTGVNGSGATWDVAVRAASSGTFDLDVSSSNNIIDAASNRLSNTDPPDPDQTYLADLEPPSVDGIARHDPADRATSRADLVFRVTFSEPVAGVDPADFELSRGTGSITDVTGSGATRDVAVAASSGGTLDLDISSTNDIVDGVGRPLSNTDPPASLDETYLVDLEPPSIASITRHDPASQATSRTDLTFRVAFSEPVAGVDRFDFEISGNGSGTVTGVAGSGSSYRVAVSATSDGSYGLEISQFHDIADLAGNLLPYPAPATGAHQAYLVDTAITPPPAPPPPPPPAPFQLPFPLLVPPAPPPDESPPGILSVTGVDPPGNATNRHMMVFNVTFGEPVTGVDRTDFVLSYDDGIAPLNHTSRPALAIPHLRPAQDVITAVDHHPGVVSSVILGLNITHPDPSNLTVRLASPDGTTRTITPNGTAGGPSGVSYLPDFAGAAAAGNWTLSVTDGLPGRAGTLHSWSLWVDPAPPPPDPRPASHASRPALAIPHLRAAQDVIAADHHPGAVSSVTLGLNLTHPDPSNLTVQLASPDGTTRTITPNGTGGGPSWSAYLPDFDGAEAAGNWTLSATDGSPGRAGILHGWNLTISRHAAPGVISVDGPGPSQSYLVTARAVLDGAYTLDVIDAGHGIADAAGNPLNVTIPPAARHAYAVDTIPPALLSIYGAAPPDGAAAALFNITFSEPVTGVDQADFALSPPWAGYVSNLTGSGSSYLVAAATTANTTTAIYLALVPEGHGIADMAGNGLADAAAVPAHRAEAAPRMPSRTAAGPPSRDNNRTGPSGDAAGDILGSTGDCPACGRAEEGR